MKIVSFISILTLLFGSIFFNEDDLPINKIQVIGSHNSYKQAIDPALFNVFKQTDSISASKIEYTHISLPDQLSMGLRNLEIDVYADAKGGRYANPKGLEWAKNQAPFDASGEMKAPGFKVLHIPDLDFRSSVLTFKNCLVQLKKWSEANPSHSPVFITLEAKDDSLKRPGFTQPEPFTSATFNELDQAIRDNLGIAHLLIPDEVRGKYSTLEEAVLKQNWPTVNAAKGKFIFILDAVGKKRATYIENHPSLKNRVLFVNATPGTPEAAILILNNPKNSSISPLVKKGYIIRTRADADTQQARANDKSDFDLACASGAQIITTDYYLKSKFFKSDYVVKFDDGKYFRANPLFKTNIINK